jgi:hypothetical protein
VDEKTLITNAEKADDIGNKFAESHNNTMISPGGFNTDSSTYTSPRDLKGVVKKTEKRQGSWWRCY